MKISKELEKPAIFHCRNGKNPKIDNAYQDLFEILVKEWEYNSNTNKRGILHSFSGSIGDAKKAIELNLYLGINGTFTYPKNKELREIVKIVGINNIVIETDCPYLPPQSMRGKRNTPLSVIEILNEVAAFLGVKFSEFQERIFLNSTSFIE